MEKFEIDIIVVGSCNIDMHWFTSELPQPGETLLGKKFSKGFGGKGANEAVAAGLLGAKVALIAMVGDDEYGKEYLDHLTLSGIITDYVGLSKNTSTGMACVTIDKNGENFIVVIPGANWEVSPQYINSIFKPPSTGNGVVDRPNGIQNRLSRRFEPLKAKVLVTQREVPDTVVLESLKWAKGQYLGSSGEITSHHPEEGQQTITIFNPSPIKVEERGTLYASGIFEYCDIICLNEVEARILTAHIHDDLDINQVSFDNEIVELSKRNLTKLMLATKVGAVILTVGKYGVLFAERKNPTCVKHVVTPKVDAIDTSGAGDSFLGSLAFYHAVYPQLDLHQIINRACYISAQTVRKHGTQSSYPVRAELPDFLF